MDWTQIKHFFNPEYEDNAWGEWVECNKKYIKDKKNQFILDAGCASGFGSALRKFELIKKVGCDIDKNLACKKYLDFWIGCSIDKLCFKTETFQAVTCNWVLEHVKNPERTIKEIHRIIDTGGYFIFRTPNIYNYAILLSYITSTKFHNFLRNLNSREENGKADNVPTYYYANTKYRLQKYLKNLGFEIVDIYYQGTASEYLTFSPLLYGIGKIGDLITNLFFLRWLKKNIVCVARKK